MYNHNIRERYVSHVTDPRQLPRLQELTSLPCRHATSDDTLVSIHVCHVIVPHKLPRDHKSRTWHVSFFANTATWQYRGLSRAFYDMPRHFSRSNENLSPMWRYKKYSRVPTLSNPGTTCQRYIVDLQLIYTDQVSEILDLMQKLQNKIKFQDLVYYIINTII